MEKYKNIIVCVWSNYNCLAGRKIKNNRDAIESDSFDIYDEERIRRCFNFGNGTMDDLKRFIKDNKMKVIPTTEFFEIVDSLPNAQIYYDFLRDILHY
jgi:hypothetical protein